MPVSLPNGFTLYDWMELVGFVWKIENEGYAYAAEEYPPAFESTALRAVAQDDDPRPLKKLFDDHEEAVEAWHEQTGWEEADRLWNEHQREEKARREAHLLWATHPGGDWDYAAYGSAYETREAALQGIARQNEAAEKYPNYLAFTGRLLHRSEPGGEWTEVPLP